MGDVADCAAIELNIQNITGVTDADDDFIRSAQKFVVSSIPSDLLLWAITETVPGTHGGNNSSQQITLPVKSDSLLFVRRDQFEAKKVDGSMRGFIGNSNSLYLATNTFPKYYIADGNRVIVKPDPDNTYTAHAQYVDFSKINDDSDLRNAVIYHAASKEFTKLATNNDSTVTTALAAVATNLGLAAAEIVLGKSEVAEIVSQTDNSGEIETALDAMKTELDKVDNVIVEASTEFDKSDALLTLGETDSESAVNDAAAKIVVEMDETQAVCDLINADLVLAKAEVVLAKEEAAEIATQTDNSGDFATAATAINTALDRIATYNWGDSDTFDSAAAQLTRVKAALNNAEDVINSNQPSATTDAYGALADEDTEILQGSLGIATTEIQRAQAHLAEWNAILQAASTEAQGFAAEVGARASFSGAKTQAVQGHISTAQSYVATAQGFVGEVQSKIAIAQGYSNEIQTRLAQSQAKREESRSRVEAGNAFVQEAQSIIAQANGYAQEAAARGSFTNAKSQAVQGYISTANAYIQAAQSYGSEAQSRLANKQSFVPLSEQYYKWAQMEVQQYIQNNSKMINKTISAQASAQQQR
tara:strand:+ start:701 stop:2467 length:1767 start_codon:yes stop_codon:yes gene_type:complete